MKQTGNAPGSQTLFEGVSCFTCSVNSSGLQTNTEGFYPPAGARTPPGRRGRSPLDDELDLAAGCQDLAQFGGSVAVGPAQGDAVRQPGDHQILRVYLELGVRDLGWFWKT